MEHDIIEFDFLPALVIWLRVTLIFTAIGLSIGFLSSVIQYKAAGPGRFIRGLLSCLYEIITLSPRRIFALTTLTFKEAVRRKALLVFVLFAILFMFAGWFIEASDDRPDLAIKNYVSFVLTTITWLVLPVMLLLSCWGIPLDIKDRALHTVVTKPTTRLEIVIGRFLGYSIVGTIVLLAMSSVGYVWIIRQTPEKYRSEYLVCRVPVFGELSFLDREGTVSEKGINVGDVWEYRSFIHGGTRARAIWKFPNFSSRYLVDDKLVLESHFEAFRTYKGKDMNTRIRLEYTLVNKEKKLRVPLGLFQINEFTNNVTEVPRKIKYHDQKLNEDRTVNLIEDLAPDGNLTVEVACFDPGQLIGMGRPDFFIRTPDKPFYQGFAKTIFGIWLLLLLVVGLGVSASCFVKGPVASLLILSLLIIGQGARNFLDTMIDNWNAGTLRGGGVTESIYRLLTHSNETRKIEAGFMASAIKAIDESLFQFLAAISHIIPDFTKFQLAPILANGFDISWSVHLFPAIAMTLGFLAPCILLGYFSLKFRELESK